MLSSSVTATKNMKHNAVECSAKRCQLTNCYFNGETIRYLFVEHKCGEARFRGEGSFEFSFEHTFVSTVWIWNKCERLKMLVVFHGAPWRGGGASDIRWAVAALKGTLLDSVSRIPIRRACSSSICIFAFLRGRKHLRVSFLSLIPENLRHRHARVVHHFRENSLWLVSQ